MSTEHYTSDGDWQRPTAFYNQYAKYGAYLVFALVVLWGIWVIRVEPSRLLTGFGEGVRLLSGMYPPAFGQDDPNKWALLSRGISESVYMAMVASVVGVALSIPFAFTAAENIAPRPVYYLSRFVIAISRALHSLVLAIIIVAAFGFGAFAGVITLAIKTVGFFSKLLAEDIEDIDMGQLEAIKATGAGPLMIMVYGVVPQVIPRFVGLAVYRWDINIRASTILGIVGAGGIGATLTTAFENFEYDFAAAILLSIIVIVLGAEAVSAYIRGRVQ